MSNPQIQQKLTQIIKLMDERILLIESLIQSSQLKQNGSRFHHTITLNKCNMLLGRAKKARLHMTHLVFKLK